LAADTVDGPGSDGPFLLPTARLRASRAVPGVGVLDEPVQHVVPGRVVVDDVRHRGTSAAEFEPVAVARRVVPPVPAVAEGPGVLDGHRRGELTFSPPYARRVIRAALMPLAVDVRVVHGSFLSWEMGAKRAGGAAPARF
jgi:hypothetical protein